MSITTQSKYKTGVEIEYVPIYKKAENLIKAGTIEEAETILDAEKQLAENTKAFSVALDSRS